MSGDLLRTATYANPTSSYFVKNGDSPAFPAITTDELTVNSVGSGNGILLQSATGDANMTIQGNLEANLNLDAPTTHLILQAQDNTGASEIILRSALFGSGDNVNEVIISPNDPLYGAPTNLIQQNAYKPGGAILRQSLTKENGSDTCFTSLTTDFLGSSQNIATTVLSVLDSNAMAVQSLTLQPNGATLSGPLEVQSGEITLGGKPASVSGKVLYANDTSGQWTIPALGQTTLSQTFGVIAGHTYRVSNQMLIDNADTATTSETAILVAGTGIQSRIKVFQNSPDTYLNGQAGGYSCYFKAPTTVSDLTVIGQNSSATTATVLSAQQFNYWIVEDMGVI